MPPTRTALPALTAKKDCRLSSGQRYHFIAGRLPWFADGFNLLFNVAAIGWSPAMVLAPQKVHPPMIHGANSADTLFWLAVLLIQSLSYLAAVIVAAVAAMPDLPARLIGIHEFERPEKLLNNNEKT